jgi:hypothetical protein
MATQNKKSAKSETTPAANATNSEVKKPEVDASGVPLNVSEIEAEVRASKLQSARELLASKEVVAVDFRRILLVGVDNFSRISSAVELSKTPAMVGLISSFSEWGWNDTEAPLILRRVKATAAHVEAHRNLLIQLGGSLKKISAGIYGEANVDQGEYVKWLIANITFVEGAEYYVPVAGVRRSTAIVPANYARSFLHLSPASFVKARVLDTDTDESILAQINVVENTLKNQGLEALGALDYYKVAFELLRKDPTATKASHCAAMGIARQTAEKYLEAAGVARLFPELRLCFLTGRDMEQVPSEMKKWASAFCLTEDQMKAAMAAIYSFKGMTSSGEFAALRDGRLAPGSTVELPSNLKKYREDFAKWLGERKTNLMVSHSQASGELKRQIERLTAETVLWDEVYELAMVGYFLFKGNIIGTKESREKTASKTELADVAAVLKNNGLTAIAPIVGALADGDVATAKARATSVCNAGSAISLVVKMVERYGDVEVVRRLKAMDDEMSK